MVPIRRGIKVDKTLRFVEEPVEIMDRERRWMFLFVGAVYAADKHTFLWAVKAVSKLQIIFLAVSGDGDQGFFSSHLRPFYLACAWKSPSIVMKSSSMKCFLRASTSLRSPSLKIKKEHRYSPSYWICSVLHKVADFQRKLVTLAVAGANSKIGAPVDPTKELSMLVYEHKYEEAFTYALQRSDVWIISWERTPPKHPLTKSRTRHSSSYNLVDEDDDEVKEPMYERCYSVVPSRDDGDIVEVNYKDMECLELEAWLSSAIMN
ncbi:hypothetical protein Tco_0646450, partial [Tanacetum coccineum]